MLLKLSLYNLYVQYFNEFLSPSAGDGVLLRVLWNGHVFGMHRRRAQRTCDRSTAGCSGAAQSCTEEPAGRYSQQVHAAQNNTNLTVKLSQYLKLIFIPFFRLYTESVIFLPTF